MMWSVHLPPGQSPIGNTSLAMDELQPTLLGLLNVTAVDCAIGRPGPPVSLTFSACQCALRLPRSSDHECTLWHCNAQTLSSILHYAHPLPVPQ
jgi:hypothetical protein